MEKRGGVGEVQKIAIGAVFSLFLFSFVINILMLSGPLFMLQIYDRVLSSGSVPTLAALTLLITGLFAFMAILDAVRARVFLRIGERTDEALQTPAFMAVLRRTWRSADPAGAQPLRDLDTLRGYLASPGPAAFFDVPWVPVYLGAIYILHPLLGHFSVAAAIVLIALTLLTEFLTGKKQASAANASEDAYRFADEVRRLSDVVTVLGMGRALNNEWVSRKARALDLHSATGNRTSTLSAVTKTLRLLFQSFILATGAWLAIQQEITPGAMIAASIIMARALAPIEQLIGSWRLTVNARRAWSRLTTLLKADSRSTEAPLPLPRPQGRLTVTGLSCYVAGNPKPLVSRVQFALDPGAGLGIIGPSGSGKTTLTKALLGIWPLTHGEVRLDGATYDQWDRDELGKHIGYLPQDITLLPGTLAQNIARFDPDGSSEKIIAAARIAGVHELALSLEKGYDTPVGPDGVQLSAGQRQRVALARAVYGNPSLVVLDEPNSNLDALGEIALHNAILALRQNGTTVIVVAHRPSALNAIDRLLVLSEGVQVEFGPKEEVLRKVTRVAQPANADRSNVSELGAGPVRAS